MEKNHQVEICHLQVESMSRASVLRSSLQEGDMISFMVEQKPGGKAEAVSVERI